MIIETPNGLLKWRHCIVYALNPSNINNRTYVAVTVEKSNNTITTDLTTPQVCRYITLCLIKAPRRGVLPSRPAFENILLICTFFACV